jgi:hypothetical protein
MTLTVGSDTYISIADADAYFSARDISTWAAATTEARTAGLLQATVYLDGAYSFIGRIADGAQALAWPRLGAVDGDGRSIEGIPGRVAHACAELALIALAGPLAPPEHRGGQVTEERAGPLSVSYAPGAPIGRTFPYIDLLLSGLIVPERASVTVDRS